MSSVSGRADNRAPWAVWLAVLCAAGVLSLSAVPPWMLEGHRDVSLAWMFTLACAAIAAEAVWHGRDHRGAAAAGMKWGVIAVWLFIITSPGPFAIPGVPAWILVAVTLSAWPLARHAASTP